MLLIVSDLKNQAEDLSDMMNFMGVISVAAGASEAIFEISPIYRALVVITPDLIGENTENALLEKCVAATIPSFSLGMCRSYKKYSFNLSEGLSASEILERIKEKCKLCGFDVPGEYKSAGIDVSQARRDAIFLSNKIELTKTELMIVRALLRLYPNPVKPDEILKFSFRKMRSPDEGSIRTHISKINKKAMKTSGRTLILNLEKLGYVLSLK